MTDYITRTELLAALERATKAFDTAPNATLEPELSFFAAELRRGGPAEEPCGNYTQAMSDARSVVTPPATNAEEQDKALQYAADMADRGWCQDCGHHRNDHGARGAVGTACSWVGCACKEWSRFAVPAGTVKARPHIVDGEFQSDKYPSCPRGKVPLSVKDKTAQDLLWEYAQRRRAVDSDFADDLEFALREAGYTVAAVERIAEATMIRVYQRAQVRVELVPWCPQCGFDPVEDEDGCCASCGATCGGVGDWRALMVNNQCLNDVAMDLGARLAASTKHINCQDKDIAEHEALIEKLRAEWERTHAELGERVRERNAAASASGMGAWVWSDTDNNDIATMGDDMVVTMRAKQLRSLLSERDKQAATEATVAERTRIVAAIRRNHSPGDYPWNMAAVIERGER